VFAPGQEGGGRLTRLVQSGLPRGQVAGRSGQAEPARLGIWLYPAFAHYEALNINLEVNDLRRPWLSAVVRNFRVDGEGPHETLPVNFAEPQGNPFASIYKTGAEMTKTLRFGSCCCGVNLPEPVVERAKQWVTVGWSANREALSGGKYIFSPKVHEISRLVERHLR